MKMWKFRSLKQFLASCLWNLSEWSGIGLGKFAPAIFESMMSVKGKNVTKQDEKRN